MKKIKKTQASGFYIFHGEVAANSNFIETIHEAKQFLIYSNFFLKEYLTVYDYNITRHEWHMVVKLKSVEVIRSLNNAGHDFPENELPIWRIISERMRLFLSQYVRIINKIRGRTGTLVHSSYERYFFESLGEAIGVIQAIKQQTFRFYDRKPKYRGLKKHYLIPRKLGKGSIFLCSKEIKHAIKKGRKLLKNQYLSNLSSLLLEKLIISTSKLHSQHSTQIPHPKLE